MLNREDKEKLARIMDKQIDVWESFYSARLTQIKKYEDMYALKVRKQLKSRFNVPLPILSGYVDTFKSKIDEFPTITYKPQKEADLKVSKKVSAFWDVEQGPNKGNWQATDRAVKTLMMFSGRGTYKYFASSDPEYKSNFLPVDYRDEVFEPQGGSDKEKHLFAGQVNIFKTKYKLEEGKKSGLYNKEAVMNIISRTSNEKIRDEGRTLESSNNRMQSLGLETETNQYVGVDVYNLTEMITVYNGKRYYVFYERGTNNILRCEPLTDIVSDDLYPFVSFASHEDPFNYASKCPCDDVYPVADSMVTLFNQGMDNLQKRNWGMRGVDTSVVKNINQLQWRPDGLVEFDGKSGNIRNALVELETPDNTVAVTNLVGWMDSYLGQKTGINSSTQGQAERNKKVGVFFGELQQAADRVDYVSKMYREAHAKIGKRFITGLKDNLVEAQAIKIIGNNGIEWDELRKEEISEFDVEVSGGNAEAQLNEIKSQKQALALDKVQANPMFAQSVNPKKLLEAILQQGDFEDAEIRALLDTDNKGDSEILSEASQSIDDIMEGKEPEMNRGATIGFVQKINDFAIDKVPMSKPELFDKLMAYSQAHIPIAIKNGKREVAQQKTAQAKNTLQTLPQTEDNGIPMQSPEGAMSRSQNFTDQASPQL